MAPAQPQGPGDDSASLLQELHGQFWLTGSAPLLPKITRSLSWDSGAGYVQHFRTELNKNKPDIQWQARQKSTNGKITKKNPTKHPKNQTKNPNKTNKQTPKHPKTKTNKKPTKNPTKQKKPKPPNKQTPKTTKPGFSTQFLCILPKSYDLLLQLLPAGSITVLTKALFKESSTPNPALAPHLHPSNSESSVGLCSLCPWPCPIPGTLPFLNTMDRKGLRKGCKDG